MAQEHNNPTADDLRAPLLAAVGAADLALATVNEILANLRERAGEARNDAESRVEETRGRLNTRVDETRGRLTELQEDLPKQLEDLRGRLNSEELRRAAESYAEAAQSTYANLVERGAAALERLRSNPQFEDTASRAEGAIDRGVELTQEALGSVAAQTRAVGERAAKLVGVELPRKTQEAAEPAKQAVEQAPVKKAPAKKAAVKTPPPVPATKAPTKSPAAKTPAAKTPAAKTPAAEAPITPAKVAAKTTAKKAAPAKKAPAKKVTQK
ncbi:heparin-binding hemagglutinin [Mycobacterium sp. MYCO198283]|uniref:heparin-binding hemagglutinin n=1 Tax=Mycobacterium sp. MYCO198283 TaxID=2883505 RepID=UPI001E4264F1|nr:heparin-binding hemagglutinin [Mycobacterium sp. MYCO198283]MCG5432287.1 heparin-binding hemagglutinin [Mycobacterium sp. MYCO198283]